ncbi:MAG: response regulator [Chlamydiota bacterium]
MKTKHRLLIADPATALIDKVTAAKEARNYEIAVAKTGPAVLKTVKEFEPELIVIDLMMPHIHAIEILKTLKASPHTRPIGVIIASYHIMIQNYHAAIEAGVDYFLSKPFSIDHLFTLIDRYFQKTLTPDPFSLIINHTETQTHCYHPTASTFSSYIRFWGTRGSNPVAGANYVRYGGNTSCLEIKCGHDRVIIDAGTGIRELGEYLQLKEGETMHLLISHTHWDHITGFPFFNPLYQKNCSIVIWAPIGFEKNTKELFTNMLAHAYFPVRLDEMKAQISFKELRDNRPISIGNLVIDTHFTNHPGPTLGFKIKTPNQTIGYITDNEALLGYSGHPNAIHRKHPLLEPHLSLIAFLKDCPLVIHEAQYFPEEYARKIGWGHSSISNATVIIKYIGCKEWIVTHHDPSHNDRNLQIKAQLHRDVVADCNLQIKVDIAYDGLMIPV